MGSAAAVATQARATPARRWILGPDARSNGIVLIVIEKSALPASPPQRQHLVPIFALQRGRHVEKRPEQDGAVVVGEFDQSRLLNQPTKFNQVARPLATIDDPLPCVGAALAGFSAVRHCLDPLDRCQRLLEVHDQLRAIAVERRLRRTPATPPALWCPST